MSEVQRDGRRALGTWGEAFAATYLERHGYQIIERGWRCRSGEIDLVAIDGTTLVIVEVRTRRGARRGTAEESITPTKQQRLVALTDAYLQTRTVAGTPWDGPYRIDIIAITLDRAGAVERFNHLVSAVGA